MEEVQNISPSGLFSRERIWPALGWGLCLVFLLGFSPRLFHFQEYLFFGLLGIGILARVWEGRSLRIRNPLMVPFLSFVGWVAVTIPFSIDPMESLKEWQKVVAQIAVFYGTCLMMREQQDGLFHRKLLAVLILGTIVTCTYSLVDFWGRGGNIWDRNIRAGFPLPGGPDFTWLSTNVLMMLPMLAVGAFFVESMVTRIGLAMAMVLAAIGLIFSYTRGVWLGCMGQVVLAAWIINRKMGWWMVGVGGGLVVGLIVIVASQGLHRETFDPWTVKARLAVWEMSAEDIIANPIVGVGYGVPIFEKQHMEHIAHLESMQTGIPKIPEKPHNWYLMIAMGSGLPGLMLFIWLLVKIWQILWIGFRHSDLSIQRYWCLGTLLMATGFYIRIFFDDSFGGTHSYLFWILVGVAMSNGIRQTDNKAFPAPA